MIILSILIPTTPDRHSMFVKLFDEVYRQIGYMQTVHPSLGKIEVLVDDSKRFLDGGLSIGKKREALVKRAEGKYLCFLDSDDWIAPNYVETLVRLCQVDADVCTFRSISKFENFWTIIDMSLGFENMQATPNNIVDRNAWHICPVKSEYAKLYEFPDSNYGEDIEWMSKVLSHCKHQTKSWAVIHQYNHGKHSEADKIMKHV